MPFEYRRERRGPRERIADEEEVESEADEYGPDPRESLARRIERHTAIRPVTDHRLEPVTTIDDISYMAGFGGRGFDALDGIDRMVMGEADATAELRVESATEGGPLELGAFETLYSDDVGYGDLDPSLPLTDSEDPAYFDWVESYRVSAEEMP